jgi:hypothetical protein
VDSLVGSAELLAEDRHIVLLSHSAGGAVTRAQKALRPALEDMNSAVQFSEFTVTIRRTSEKPFPAQAEKSERGRTLLFVGQAAVLASTLGVGDVFLNENGVMAVHTPISDARMGSYSTKTAAPSVLRGMQTLFSLALDHDIQVVNRLLKRTKPEVVQKGIDLGLESALGASVSCWSINRHGDAHCGVCVPCIVRRMSFVHAEAPDANYQVDVTAQGLPRGAPGYENLIHYLSYAHDLVTLDDGHLEMRYGEIIEESAELSFQESMEMHRRWGRQVRDIVTASDPLRRLWGAE